MCVHKAGEPNEHKHERRGGTKVQGCTGSVMLVPCASSWWPVLQFFPPFPVTSLYPSHSASTLCSEHTRMIIPTGCLCKATLPLDSCSRDLGHTCCPVLLHPLLAPTAPAAFKSHTEHCPLWVCKAFLITPTALCLHCLLSSVLFSFVQMSNITINLFTYLFPSSSLGMRARITHFHICSPDSC